mmetsp:Transcript_12016/g.18166  ORF Transcript_12016/g.18166 Transcript_12016/m.18166 type:complete len:220 (-) Transcript_12016:384-1043(-)
MCPLGRSSAGEVLGSLCFTFFCSWSTILRCCVALHSAFTTSCIFCSTFVDGFSLVLGRFGVFLGVAAVGGLLVILLLLLAVLLAALLLVLLLLLDLFLGYLYLFLLLLLLLLLLLRLIVTSLGLLLLLILLLLLLAVVEEVAIGHEERSALVSLDGDPTGNGGITHKLAIYSANVCALLRSCASDRLDDVTGFEPSHRFTFDGYIFAAHCRSYTLVVKC